MLLKADQLNADCTCISLNRAALCRALEAEVGDPEFCHKLIASHPTLISSQPVFLRGEHVARMAAIIQAIEAIAKLEEYQSAALRSAPTSSHFRPGAIGVFMGFDFHLGPRSEAHRNQYQCRRCSRERLCGPSPKRLLRSC